MRLKPSMLSIVTIPACMAACLSVVSTTLAMPLPGRVTVDDTPALTTLVQGADDAKRDKKGPPGKGGGPLAAAAKELGISERALADAVGPAPPNIERGAKALGIPQEKLRAVLEKHRPLEKGEKKK